MFFPSTGVQRYVLFRHMKDAVCPCFEAQRVHGVKICIKRLKMKNILLTLTMVLFVQTAGFAQKSQLVFINTVEYLDFLDGGSSFMYIQSTNGVSERIDLKGLFSIAAYLSEKKFAENQSIIHQKIQSYLDDGYQIADVTTNTRQRSAQGTGTIPSYIITRYILVKNSK